MRAGYMVVHICKEVIMRITRHAINDIRTRLRFSLEPDSQLKVKKCPIGIIPLSYQKTTVPKTSKATSS